MQSSESHYLIVIIIGSAVFLALATFITAFLIFFRQKQVVNKSEKQSLLEAHQRELLQSQIEIQNQTLQQIAEELHDHVGQLLTVAVLRLNVLEDEVTEPGVQQSVQQTQEIVRTIIDDVRALAKTLDHNTVQRFGLLPSLKFELERIQRMGRVQTHLITSGDVYSLGEQAETVLLRMAQEALNNALKHARAQSLTVSADYLPDTFTLTITDDGRGFGIDATTNRSLEEAGAGLGNLARRAGLLGGTCQVVSRPDEGTRVTISVPHYHVSP